MEIGSDPAKLLVLMARISGFLLLDEFDDFLGTPDKPEDSEPYHSDPNEYQQIKVQHAESLQGSPRQRQKMSVLRAYLPARASAAD